MIIRRGYTGFSDIVNMSRSCGPSKKWRRYGIASDVTTTMAAPREDEPIATPTVIRNESKRLTVEEVTMFAEGKLDMAYLIQPQRPPLRRVTALASIPPPKPPRRPLNPLALASIVAEKASAAPLSSQTIEEILPSMPGDEEEEEEEVASPRLGHQRIISSPPLTPKSSNIASPRGGLLLSSESSSPQQQQPLLSPKAKGNAEAAEPGAWRLGGSNVRASASHPARRLTSPRPRVITTKTIVAIPMPRICPLCKNCDGKGQADIRMIGYWATRGETVYMCLKTRSGELHPTSPTDVCGYMWTSYIKMPMCFTCNVLMFVEPRTHRWTFVCKECRREAQKPDNDNPADDDDDGGGGEDSPNSA